MANSVTYDKLKQIGEEIAQIKDEREFGRRLKYELMDFIERNPVLHDEWKRRSEFYEKLPSTLEFQSLLDSIHKGFSELKKRIDPKKLPMNIQFSNQDRPTPESPERLSQLDVYKMLSSRTLWPRFSVKNVTTGVYVPSRGTPPWDSALSQYDIFQEFFFRAERAKAVRGGVETDKIALQVFADIKSLRDCVTTPLVRWHLHAFYDVKFYGGEPEYILKVDSLSRSVSRVCSELLFHLKELEEQRKNSGKKPKIVKSVVRGILTTTTGKEIPFSKKKAKTALLCEKVCGHCREVGDTVRIEVVFQEIWKDDYDADPIKNCKTVDSAARNVNKWAKKHGLPDLLQCTTEYVERLA